MIQRTPERDLLPMAKAFGLSVTPWSPLGGGILTGKYNQPSNNGDNNRLSEIPRHQLEIADAVVQIAANIGCSPSQLALAWLKTQSETIIPIIGARKLSQFQDNLDCLKVNIASEQLQRLNEVSKIELGFPHDFLANNTIRERLYGGTYHDIQFK